MLRIVLIFNKKLTFKEAFQSVYLQKNENENFSRQVKYLFDVESPFCFFVWSKGKVY